MNDYKSITSDIANDIKVDHEAKGDAPISDDRMASATTMETEEYAKFKQYYQRDASYTKLLNDYIEVYREKTKWKKWYKLVFFSIAMLTFLGLIVGAMVLFIIIAGKEKSTVADIALIVGAVAGVLSAIIILPRIIAEHLFPTNEDEHMIDMVKNMQVNDSNIRMANKLNKNEKRKTK